MAYEAWTVEIEYTAGVWTDVTSRVDTAGGSFAIQGGDTPEASADTGGMILPLQNHDQAFTPGNVLSALALQPGLRVRVRETVLDRVFDRFTGYTAYPEIEAWTESNATTPRDQLLMLPAVDRAAWLAQGRTFVSTLAEHVIHHGGPALQAYWPMGEAEGPDVNPAVGAPWTLTQTFQYNVYSDNPAPGTPAIAYGTGTTAAADDLGAVTFTPSRTDTDYIAALMLSGTRPTTLTLDAGQVVTVVGWTTPGEIVADAVAHSIIELTYSNTGAGNSGFVAIYALGDVLGVEGFSLGNWAGSILDGPKLVTGHAMPIAIRFGFDPAVIELWVRDQVFTDTVTVTTPTARPLDVLHVADLYPGAINHVQVYLGDPDDWTHDDFLAQYEMGQAGLERQRTGQRIRTVLEYAGVDPYDLDRIDTGSSVMQVARMAGRNPMELVAEAVATEQGEFYIAGDNRPVFAGRRRLYNI